MNDWQKESDYPVWMTEESLKTLFKGYLLEDESPKKMYQRIVDAIEKVVINDYESKIVFDKTKLFDYLWKGWLCPASPILSNLGTNRGLPISCFGIRPADSTDSIFKKLHEMAMLTKYGGGIGVSFDKIRGRGEVISKGGFTEGVVPFMKIYDSAIHSVSQGGVRRGSIAAYLPIRHKDIEEFIDIREEKGDLYTKCLSTGFHHAVSIDDVFMEKVEEGDSYYRSIFSKVLNQRLKKGEPYIMYYDNVNRASPSCYKKNNLKINTSQLCSEILLYNDDKHSFVCCLSSLNLNKYDEWKNDIKDLTYYSVLFLDCVMNIFINQAKNIHGFENAIRHAIKSRPLGLGVLGWHDYLQKKSIPFNSISSKGLIKTISSKLRQYSNEASTRLGSQLGIPEWCIDTRNSHMMAIAPTTSNSLISGGTSNGIEPFICNAYVQKSAKGTFIRKNRNLLKLMETKYPQYNNEAFWNKLMTEYKGSIQQFDFFDNLEKEVFLTAYEINQLELIRNAALWQANIDQGISLNTFFPSDVDPKWFAKCHLEAWKIGIKTLYYVRSESIASRSMSSSTFSDCVYCEG